MAEILKRTVSVIWGGTIAPFPFSGREFSKFRMPDNGNTNSGQGKQSDRCNHCLIKKDQNIEPSKKSQLIVRTDDKAEDCKIV